MCPCYDFYDRLAPRIRSELERTGYADKLYYYLSYRRRYPDLLYVFIISLICVYLAFRATVVLCTSDNLSFLPLAASGWIGGPVRLRGAGKRVTNRGSSEDPSGPHVPHRRRSVRKRAAMHDPPVRKTHPFHISTCAPLANNVDAGGNESTFQGPPRPICAHLSHRRTARLEGHAWLGNPRKCKCARPRGLALGCTLKTWPRATCFLRASPLCAAVRSIRALGWLPD